MFVLHVRSIYISLENTRFYIFTYGYATRENIVSNVHSVKYLSILHWNKQIFFIWNNCYILYMINCYIQFPWKQTKQFLFIQCVTRNKPFYGYYNYVVQCIISSFMHLTNISFLRNTSWTYFRSEQNHSTVNNVFLLILFSGEKQRIIF